ncbi:hypothetical protein FHU34_114582 [Micromonospora taraxaci]|uniref:Uncharacterized protein n=1 Tax=Micromonospora taraxaci TaxID=1316803 RepID=A0A561W5Q7_9ACTN|nr:hypothetical protein FHU34_114582 [Micromonospora taraxaci]
MRSSAGSTTCARPSSNAPNWARTVPRQSRTAPPGVRRPGRSGVPRLVRAQEYPCRRRPRGRPLRGRATRTVPALVGRPTAPGRGRRHRRAAARTSGPPRPAPVPLPLASQRVAVCNRPPVPAPPYRRRHPPPVRSAVTRPAHRALTRLRTRPAARSVLAPRRLPPDHPWALRAPAPRRVVARIPAPPADSRTPCLRCAVRTPPRRAVGRARSPSSPAEHARRPRARPPVAGPPDPRPIRRGPPGRPLPAWLGSTARRLAPSPRRPTACDPTPPSSTTHVPPGVGRARSTPGRRSPPAAVPPSPPAPQAAAVVVPPNPTSRWCPARVTHHRCPRRPAATAARRPPSSRLTAPVAAGPPPTNRSGVRQPAANPGWTARSGPPTGCARPVACRTPTQVCPSSTAEGPPRHRRVGDPCRPPTRGTSSTTRPVDSAYRTRPRSAPPPAGPPACRPTRERRRRQDVAPSGRTRQVPPANRLCPIRRRPATDPAEVEALRRPHRIRPVGVVVRRPGPVRTGRPLRIRPVDDVVRRPNPAPTARLVRVDPDPAATNRTSRDAPRPPAVLPHRLVALPAPPHPDGSGPARGTPLRRASAGAAPTAHPVPVRMLAAPPVRRVRLVPRCLRVWTAHRVRVPKALPVSRCPRVRTVRHVRVRRVRPGPPSAHPVPRSHPSPRNERVVRRSLAPRPPTVPLDVPCRRTGSPAEPNRAASPRCRRPAAPAIPSGWRGPPQWCRPRPGRRNGRYRSSPAAPHSVPPTRPQTPTRRLPGPRRIGSRVNGGVCVRRCWCWSASCCSARCRSSSASGR